MKPQRKFSMSAFLLLVLATGVFAQEGNKENSDEALIIIEGSDDQGQEDTILIEDKIQQQSDVIIIESETGKGEMIQHEDEVILQTGSPVQKGMKTGGETAKVQDFGMLDIGIDELWLEGSFLTRSSESVNTLNYGHMAFSAVWDIDPQWEARLSGRLDGYRQTGSPNITDLDLDYDESYLRYRSESLRVTLGAQKVIWGRIDEIPPTDRLSTPDLTRFILDDLADRRRARLMVRSEYFSGDNKFDLFILPVFRKAKLPDSDSIWYPLDLRRGKILGLETSPAFAAVMATAKIIEDTPNSDGGIGFRFSRTEENFDYAVTLQRGRRTIPYFVYDGLANTFTTIYPRSNSVGFDLGFEYAGYVWRFETAAQDVVPVTKADLSYTEVVGATWAAGMEFFPGDGNNRVNLQLAGNHLLNTPSGIRERARLYNLNGSVEIPFAEERWRANIRFFLGLNQEDVYLNPEIAFLGWEPHEFYLENHYFSGDEGSLGGFHEGHSLISVGWRVKL